MKKIYLVILYLLFTGLFNDVLADYPVMSHRYLADPGTLVHNGRVYVYCSNDDENADDGYLMSSIVCVSSSDMKNWTDHGVVFDVPRDASWSGRSWAPSPVYRNGKFYLYFGNGGSAIGVAVSDSPTGPFVDPIGRSLVDGSTPGVQPFDGWLFDPMTFVDDDGQAYMYFGGNGDDNLRVIRLNEDMISINGSAGRFNVPNFFEAAWVHKYNGTYYFSYSTTPSAGMRIDYMTSSDPMSGFTYGGIMSPQPPNNNNNNHQAVFELNGQWYQMYHNRIVAAQNGDGTTYHRNLAVDAFSHRQDGSIVQMVNTVDGLEQVGYLDPYRRVEAETMSEQNGIETEVCSAGGMNLSFLDNNDWIMVEGVDFGSAGAGSFSASVATNKTGGTIEIRLGSPTGTLAGTLQVPNTGGFQAWQTVTSTVNKVTGIHNVYFVFKGSGSSLFNVDHWSFYSTGPIVNITSPLSSDVFFEGDDITMEATAEAQEGSVSQVEFFVDGQSIGTDNTAPYSFTYSNATAGSHTIEVVATDSQGEQGSVEIVIQVNIPQGPYGGTLHPIPGTIQLEEFDVGGNGFAYFDDTPGSETGVAFRTDEDVDVEECTDAGGGYNLGWTTAGEWLEYSVDVEATGTYDLELRVACNGDNRTLSVEMDGAVIAGDVAIPNTAGWQTWQTVTVNDVALTAGEQIMRVTIGAEDYINLNYVTFTAVDIPVPPTVSITSPSNSSSYTILETVTISADAADQDGTVSTVEFYAGATLIGSDNSSPYSIDWSGMNPGTYDLTAVATDNEGNSATSATVTVTIEAVQSPYNGTAHPIPGRIEAEEYDLGGEGLGYHEANTNGNEGGATLRNDEVDIEATQDVDGSYNIGYALNGEWLEYSVNVTENGNYDLDLRVAADGDGKVLHVEMDGVDITGAINVPNTGGWQTWQTVTLNDLPLTAGEHEMRIVFDADYMNLNYVEFRGIITGFSSIEDLSAKVFPNPFNDNGLQIQQQGDFTYQITDVRGTLIASGSGEEELSVGQYLRPGVYFLTIKNAHGIQVQKIIKE